VARWSRRIDPAIEEAIREGVKAGAFWTAAKFNPLSAKIWEQLAQHHARAATNLLRTFADRQSPE
jgi:hypothetical protein